MTLFEARPPDPRDEQRSRHRVMLIVAVVLLVLIASATAYWFRYWPEERIANKFFNALEQKDFESAYALWRADPDWKQHLDRYKEYPYGQFQLDWGPTGDYGQIKSHKVEGSLSPRSKGRVSGVVVVVTVNNRVQPACIWVEKATKTITFSPIDCAK